MKREKSKYKKFEERWKIKVKERNVACFKCIDII